MKKILISIIASVAAAFSASFPVRGQDMEWFSEAKLGIFIHWGIYAVDGVSESWSFYNGYVPYDTYMAQTKRFLAENYDPHQWVSLIKESGARYTVITSKHHDGVALWNTAASKLSVPRQTPAGRDVLTPFVHEVRMAGLKLGLYYSLLDWSHPDYPNWTRTTTRYSIKDDPARWQRFVDFDFAQLRELSEAYRPDLLWFDGDWEQTAEDWHAPEIIKLLREYNPDIVVNSRIQGYGDYGTPEIGVPTTRPADRYWELCYTMNDSWGFQHKDTNFKTPEMIVRTLVDCISLGGNLLLDIGPRADGTIPEEEVSILKELGRWTSKHAEAVYPVRAGIPGGFVNAYTALNKDGSVLYLYFPYRPIGTLEVKGIMNAVKSIRVVGSDTPLTWKIYNKLSWSEVPGLLDIEVPEEILDPSMTVIAVELDGPIRLYQGAGKVITSN